MYASFGGQIYPQGVNAERLQLMWEMSPAADGQRHKRLDGTHKEGHTAHIVQQLETALFAKGGCQTDTMTVFAAGLLSAQSLAKISDIT